MSHFVVIVVGDDHEKQLAPYHEFECTGLDDEYVQDIDKTQEELENFAKYGDEGESFADYLRGDGKRFLKAGEAPDLADAHKYGWAEIDAEGSVIRVVRRTNPDRKWDWWVVGGRWTGYFPLKDGASGCLGKPDLFGTPPDARTADHARWGDVDIESARDKAEAQAREAWAPWGKILEAYDRAPTWGWTTMRKRHPGDIEKARAVYRAQPVVAAWNALPFREQTTMRCPVDEFGPSLKEYIAKCRAGALVPFAVVKDGKWYERGQMGWFACVSNEKESGDWNEEVAKLLDGLDPDTVVTAIDCHI